MAEAIFLHEGEAIDYTPTADTPAGTVVVLGELVGVARLDIAANTLGALHTEGVYITAKAAGALTALTVGALLYWDDTANTVTATATGNKPIGHVVKAAADADTTVWVRWSQ
jgi:predicted RecA/RadA family phage recombinase